MNDVRGSSRAGSGCRNAGAPPPPSIRPVAELARKCAGGKSTLSGLAERGVEVADELLGNAGAAALGEAAHDSSSSWIRRNAGDDRGRR